MSLDFAEIKNIENILWNFHSDRLNSVLNPYTLNFQESLTEVLVFWGAWQRKC